QRIRQSLRITLRPNPPCVRATCGPINLGGVRRPTDASSTQPRDDPMTDREASLVTSRPTDASATHHSGDPLASRKTSLVTYCGLVGCLVLVKLLFALRPVAFPIPGQNIAFAWTTIAVLAVAGFVGWWLVPRAGMADLWDARVSNWQRFGIPTVAG